MKRKKICVVFRSFQLYRHGAAPAGSRRVVVYRNGFTVDNGDFRPLDDPQNARFLEELKAGYVNN